MKRIFRYILLMAVFACLHLSCERRPLTTADNMVTIHFNIEKDIINYEMPHAPSLMRCVFFDSFTGSFVTQAFLPAEGGRVSLPPAKEYDVLVYNFDTESTWIEKENDIHEIYASTSVIPDAFRTKLRKRAASSDGEKIVYEPDHLFVGRLNDVFIPARSVNAEPIVLEINCETVVESWILEVKTITGVEYIGSMAGVITGLSESNKITANERSANHVSVYFDNQVIDGNGVLTARFNTFGWNPDSETRQVVSLVFTDISGKGYIFHIDVSNQFVNNKEQIIRINAEIDIPLPSTSDDGGFVPSVDDWDDINTDIII